MNGDKKPLRQRRYEVSLSAKKSMAIQIDPELDAEECACAVEWLRLALKGLERELARMAETK